MHRRLAQEVCRKLELATRAEGREDRDIVAGEVFADVTGDLSLAARERTGAIYQRWYEVLAPYFCRDWAAAEALLSVCRRLWGQPFTAPIYALLLHQWLLVHPTAGGEDQRLKHLNVMASGARSLFLGDVETGNRAFAPLFAFIAERVTFDGEDAKKRDASAAIKTTAQHPTHQTDATRPVGDGEGGDAASAPPPPPSPSNGLSRASSLGPAGKVTTPSATPPPHPSTRAARPADPKAGTAADGADNGGRRSASPDVGGSAAARRGASRSARRSSLPSAARESLDSLVAAFLPYYLPREQLAGALERFPPLESDASSSSGAERALDRIVDVLSREIRTQAGTLVYLRAIATLKGWPMLAQLRTATRLRLQGELYALTQPGGPRYATRRVNREAMAALDALFPAGRHVRRAVNLAFRTLHPQEWPWAWYDVLGDLSRAVAKSLKAWALLVAACVLWIAGKLAHLFKRPTDVSISGRESERAEEANRARIGGQDTPGSPHEADGADRQAAPRTAETLRRRDETPSAGGSQPRPSPVPTHFS